MAKNKSSTQAATIQGKAPQPQPAPARVPSLNHDPDSWELKREEQRYSKTRPQLFLNSTVRVPSVNNGEPVHFLTGADTKLHDLCKRFVPKSIPKTVVTLDNKAPSNGGGRVPQPTQVPSYRNMDNEVEGFTKNVVPYLSQFIRCNHAKPGSCYWMYKDANEALVYDISSLCQGHDKLNQKAPNVTSRLSGHHGNQQVNGSSPPPSVNGSHDNRPVLPRTEYLSPDDVNQEVEANPRVVVPVAALLLHIAKQMTVEKPVESEVKYQHVELLSSCIQLLDDPKQVKAPILLSVALYHFSMWCMVEGGYVSAMNQLQAGCQQQQANGNGNHGNQQQQFRPKINGNDPHNVQLPDHLKSSPESGAGQKSIVAVQRNGHVTRISQSPVQNQSQAQQFTHIPFALDLAFRGLEILAATFKKHMGNEKQWLSENSDKVNFQVFAKNHPMVFSLIHFTKMVCSSLCNKALKEEKYAESLVYIFLGLCEQEILDELTPDNGAYLKTLVVSNRDQLPSNNQQVGDNNKVENDIFFTIMLYNAGNIYYQLAVCFKSNDQTAIKKFITNFGELQKRHRSYFNVCKIFYPQLGHKFKWATQVPNNYQDMQKLASQCFNVAMAQYHSNRRQAVSKKEQSANSGGSSGREISSVCTRIACDRLPMTSTIEVQVDHVNPYLYIAAEADINFTLSSSSCFKQAVEVATKAYNIHDQVDKKVLCLAKSALIYRAHAVFVKNKSCDFNTTHAETDLLKKAAEKYEHAQEIYKQTGLKEDLRWDTINWNLGDTFYQLANRMLNNLQDTANSMEGDMFQYLTKSIRIWKYFTENHLDSANLKVARNRIAESHHMLACQYNQAYLEKDQAQKATNFQKAIKHYQKAATFFALAVMPTAEFFSRVGILNLLASKFAPSSSQNANLPANQHNNKVSLLKNCFEDVAACAPCLDEIVKNLQRVNNQPQQEIQSDENLLYSPTFCQNLHSWFSIFSYIITTIFKHSVQTQQENDSSDNKKVFKEAYDQVLRILQDADLLGIEGGRALSTEISTQLLLDKSNALCLAIRQTPHFNK